MKAISEFLVLEREPEVKGLTSRQEIIKKFIDRINDSRALGGYPPFPPAYIAMKMYRAGYKTDSQLHMLYGSCNDSINFSAFWHLKTGSKKHGK